MLNSVYFCMSYHDKINDAKIKIDKLLYERDVFFLVTEHDTDNFEFKSYAYFATSPKKRKLFGFIGYDITTNKVTFAAEWENMTKRNKLEGLPDPEFFILLENEEEFVDFFAGVLLTEIVSKREEKK